MTLTRLLRIGRCLIAVAILFYLMQQLYPLLSTLSRESIRLESPFWLLLSLMLLLIYYSVLGVPWFFLYRVGGNTHIPFRDGWAFFQLSQLGRYLPGKAGQFVWMLSFSRRFGIEKTGAVLASCLQLVSQCCLGCLIGLPILQRTQLPQMDNLLVSLQMSRKTELLIWSLAIVSLGIGIVLLYRQRIRETFPCLIKQGREIFSVSGVLSLTGAVFILWGLLGSAFFLFIKSCYPIRMSDFFVVTSSYAAAWCGGFLSFLTPGGLGIREGILTLLLTENGFPPATATLVALLSRLWTLSAELLIGGVAFGLYLRQRQV